MFRFIILGVMRVFIVYLKWYTTWCLMKSALWCVVTGCACWMIRNLKQLRRLICLKLTDVSPSALYLLHLLSWIVPSHSVYDDFQLKTFINHIFISFAQLDSVTFWQTAVKRVFNVLVAKLGKENFSSFEYLAAPVLFIETFLAAQVTAGWPDVMWHRFYSRSLICSSGLLPYGLSEYMLHRQFSHGLPSQDVVGFVAPSGLSWKWDVGSQWDCLCTSLYKNKIWVWSQQ